MRSIYVIGASENGPVKIGQANNPQARCLDLQTGHPQALRVLLERQCNDATAVERFAHRMLAIKRLNGEWFDASLAEAAACIKYALTGDLGSANDRVAWLAPHGQCRSCDRKRAALQATMRKRRARGSS